MYIIYIIFIEYISYLAGGSTYFLFSPLLEEMIQYD